MDILTEVYNALVADDYIKEQALDRIKFYEYPATGDVINPHIVIDPIDPPTPKDFADNNWTKLDYLLQIDVWTRDRKTTNQVADKIRDIMWNKFGFAQKAGPKEYAEGVFRDARRYRGTLYREDFDSL
ncbi:hypothetical protein [Oceanobacillus jordanicus]|uniref:DUF3168 domain-containing protein n=1 Tax=Oceanobacillus jordanicus TaxID=2867266 RepID=A0AAW5B5Y4_9BACI|nr:hypothetical protein [Oceanobacillus jordanicus]MCG3418968.1 hypothetical protein [Oceanobacillus jordanicus]